MSSPLNRYQLLERLLDQFCAKRRRLSTRAYLMIKIYAERLVDISQVAETLFTFVAYYDKVHVWSSTLFAWQVNVKDLT